MPNVFQQQAHYRKIFAKYFGDGPWLCFFCGEEVSRREKNTKLRFCIHHRNHNHDDNRKSNLKPAHWSCHIRHHTKGHAPAGPKHHTDETRAKMRAARTRRPSSPNKGKVMSLEARAKISAANRGKILTPEHRAKIGLANSRRIQSPETRAKIGAASASRTHSPETRAKMSASHKKRPRQPHSLETRAKISASKKRMVS